MDGIETDWRMVIWDDITSSEMPWMDRAEACELKPATILSVGTVVNETDEFKKIIKILGIADKVGKFVIAPAIALGVGRR